MPACQPWCQTVGYLYGTERHILAGQPEAPLYTISTKPPWTMNCRVRSASESDSKSMRADGYLSVCLLTMPNSSSPACDPNFTTANGPILTSLTFMADYIIDCCQKIAEEDIDGTYVKVISSERTRSTFSETCDVRHETRNLTAGSRKKSKLSTGLSHLSWKRAAFLGSAEWYST